MNGRKSLLAILGVFLIGAFACTNAVASEDRIVLAEDFSREV
jgi:predicted outer membrane lipoprotein